MRSIGVAINHPDPGVVDELVHAVEAAPDLYLALDASRASVVVAGESGLQSERRPGVAVVGLAVDGDLHSVARGALRCAAEDLICWPEGRSTFRAVLREAASRARLAAGGAAGRIVVIAGARGGAGTTTVAAMLARAIEGAVVVDLDAAGGGQAAFLEPNVEPTLGQVLNAIDDLDPAGLRSGFVAHAAGTALCSSPRSAPPGVESVERLVALLRATVPFTIVDTGRGFEPSALRVLALADVVVCVCAPDVGSMRGARALFAELAPARVVLNIASRARLSARDVARVLGAQPAAVVPIDHAVRRAGEAGRLPTRGPARKVLDGFARALTKELTDES